MSGTPRVPGSSEPKAITPRHGPSGFDQHDVLMWGTPDSFGAQGSIAVPIRAVTLPKLC